MEGANKFCRSAMIDNSSRRVIRDLSPEEKTRLERFRRELEAELPELREQARRDESQLQEAAMREPSISGQLRRAIASCGMTPAELGSRVGITGKEIAEFLVARRTLDSSVIDRLAACLNQELRAVTAEAE
jgi:hypothetical protein